MNGTSSFAAHVDDDLLIDLVHELLSPAHAEEVLLHLETCPDCEQRFRDCGAERERLRARVAKWMDSGFERPAPVHARVRDRATGSLSRWTGARAWCTAAGTAAAAAILLIVVAPRHDATLVVPRLPAVAELARQRGVMTSAEPELAKGLEAYDQGNVREAIQHLRGPVVDQANDAFRIVYLGAALAAAGQYREAAETLGSIQHLEDLPEPWSGAARWTEFVSLRRSGQSQAAESLRRSLEREPGSLGQRARAAKP